MILKYIVECTLYGTFKSFKHLNLFQQVTSLFIFLVVLFYKQITYAVLLPFASFGRFVSVN